MESNRSKIIVKSGYLFILTNFLLAIFNVIIGLLSNSLAIVSDAAHSLIDATSGFLIIISEKLAQLKKFSERREKIERLTTIIVALIIIASGVEILVASIKNIVSPEEVDYSLPVIVILIISIIAKFILATYLKKQGKKFNSKVLAASGAETLNDTWISVAVLASAVVYLIWRVNLEPYISTIISAIIIKVGLEFIFPHFSRHHHHPLEQNPDHDHCNKK